MHELGHNLGLQHYDDDLKWWEYLLGYYVGDGTHESCMSYIELGETIDYIDYEWDTELTLSIETWGS